MSQKKNRATRPAKAKKEIKQSTTPNDSFSVWEDVLQERLKQLMKGRDAEQDAKVNDGFQLTQAAQTLSTYKLPMSAAWEPPFNWDGESWQKYVSLPYEKRLVIATSFLIAELERLEFIAENGQPLVKPLTFKPLKDEHSKK